jgi:TetR/AcrR family transcriptional regulator, transcriptional repressor of bet genes
MPKLGMEPIRRDALVKATIREVGLRGSADVTVSQIAKAAGVSSALAHHYFGTKEALLLSAMRQILRDYGREVGAALKGARGPRARLESVVRANFAAQNFRPEVIAAWLTFYITAQTSPEAMRLLTVYKARLRSNLLHDLRPLAGDGAERAADGIGALIDGLYIRQGLGRADAGAATALVLDYLDRLLGDRA